MKTTLLGVSLLVATVMVASAAYSIAQYQTPSEKGGLTYGSEVCVNVTRAENGITESLPCHSNLLTNSGRNAIEDLLNSTMVASINQIALCNSTATEGANNSCATPAVGDTTLPGEYGLGLNCGLNRATATYGYVGTGNISWVATFTSTCNGLTTNKTALFNTSTPGSAMFASNNFTTVTLQTNDKLTVTWYVWVYSTQ